MRLRANLNAALEGQVDNTPLYGNLSMEEESQLLVEATQADAAANADLAEADRLNDMSDALEDLAVIADGIAEPSATESQLIESVGQMAVAGTDIQPDEIMPAMEHFRGSKVGVESLRETAAKVWAEIKRIVKKVWDWIESYMYKIFGTIPGLRKRIKALKERVDANGDKTIDQKKITVSSGVAALSIDYKAPTSEGDLKKALTLLADTADAVYGKGQDAVQSLGEAIVAGLGDFDPEKPASSLGKFRTKVEDGQKKLKDSIPGGGNTNTTRWPGFDAKMSAPLPGNVSIVVREPTSLRDRKEGESISLHRLDSWRRTVVELVPTSDKSKDVPTSFEMATLGNNAMDDLLSGAEKLLDVLEKFQRGKRFNDMKAMRKKLEAASEKAEKEMQKADAKEEASEREAVPYYRAMLNFNTAYTKWAKDPALPMVGNSLSFVRGIMAVCERSLAAYK